MLSSFTFYAVTNKQLKKIKALLRFTPKDNYSPGINTYGFAGDEGEFVVASLYDKELYVWSVTGSQQKKKERLNNQPLFTLPLLMKQTSSASPKDIEQGRCICRLTRILEMKFEITTI